MSRQATCGAPARHRFRGAVVVPLVLAALAACGSTTSTTGLPPAIGGDAEWDVPAELDGGLEPLAQRLADELEADYRSLDRAEIADQLPDGDGWWVKVVVEVPHDDGDLDAPAAALPPPFDQLADDVEELEIRADVVEGTRRVRIEPGFGGLREELSMDWLTVTTVPGDPPTETSAVEFTNPRITALWITVAALDASPVTAEVLRYGGPEGISLSPERFEPDVRLVDALASVPVTAPPLTGTTLRPPETTTG
ncbi:MAG: hypothetical protein AAFN30_16960 [Actinomycetota bacterium]